MKSSLLLLLAALLVMGAAVKPPGPRRNSPQVAAKKGRALVDKILSERPAQDVTNTGVLKIRNPHGQRTELPLKFEISSTPTSWTSVYEAGTSNSPTGVVKLTVVHRRDWPNTYRLEQHGETNRLSGNETMVPFAGSDFWVADLGLEFFHWPEQNLWETEMRRGRSCRVLESINPHPAPGAYSRVVSWIDIETDGIVHADAYNYHNKRLKEFNPKDFKKVNGHWQLQEMEIDNDQTGSRTWIKFNLDSK